MRQTKMRSQTSGAVTSKKDSRKKTVETSVPTEISRETRFSEMFQKPPTTWPDYVWLKGTAYSNAKRNMNMDIRIPNFDIHIGNHQLLNSTEISITYGVRYGIIGRNGIGKSVLLRSISNREGPFSSIPSWYSILHVEQEIIGDDRSPLDILLASDKERHWLLNELVRLENLTDDEKDLLDYTEQDIHERLREIEAHKANSRACSILKGLQFGEDEMKTKPSKDYSGGWRMRISLARALFMTPELLILDEPSNHLDLSAAIWLERYLSTYKKTLLLVSHDESMLNECVDEIFHFFNHKLYRYRGNYDCYVKTREQNSVAAFKLQRNQDKKIKKDKIAAQKSGKLGAKKKKEVQKTQNERVEIVMDEKAPKFIFPDVLHQKETAVIKFDEVCYTYRDNSTNVVKDLSFGIYMDSRIALVGANGSGKSTIMKLMSGELSPSQGTVQGSSQLRIVKYDQHAEEKLDLDTTAIDWLSKNSTKTETEAKTLLGRFGLHGKDVLQQIKTLSGGQKARLVFATLSAQDPHLLLLDEPTNHLDIFAIEALMEGLEMYKGGIVIISHNTKILSKCCNQTWVVSNGAVKIYNGSFDDYKNSILG